MCQQGRFGAAPAPKMGLADVAVVILSPLLAVVVLLLWLAVSLGSRGRGEW